MTTRPIAFLERGHTRGPITRLISPGDVGAHVKPFVFLDYFESNDLDTRGMGAHPHSGIATHTTLISGALEYGDSTGADGVLPPGSVEWMQAGGGVWHWGKARRELAVRGYQLWVALPPALEHAPAASHYIQPAEIPSIGNVRVLLGRHGALASPIPYHEPITYLHVTLADGERWTFDPDPTHDVAWLAVHRGALHTAGRRLERTLAVFADGHGAIELVADGATDFVIASAVRHPYPLVTGYYSVHTSPEALEIGERGIDAIRGTSRVRRALAL
jgi:redox-sensitive bicupin YhaK (pirin superfamily)